MCAYERFNVRDQDGNVLLTDEHGNVTLYLKKHNKQKSIGWLRVMPGHEAECFMYTKFVRPENVFRKTNSVGIQDYILRNIGRDGMVKIVLAGKELLIRAGDALDVGEYLWFKTEGFERQIFIPLSYFMEASR